MRSMVEGASAAAFLRRWVGRDTVGLRQLPPLHRLRRSPPPLCGEDCARRGHSSRRLLRGELRPQPEQVADRVDEIGPVHRVEVELVHTAIEQVHHLLGGDRCRDQAARRWIVVEPVERSASHCGTLAPALVAKFAVWRKFWTGTMPGMIGMSMPFARTLSR